MKIRKIEKLVANLHDKEEYIIYMRNIKETLKHLLFLKEMHILTKFNQKT